MSEIIEPPQIRITGPYEHRAGEYRCRLIIDGHREWAPTADSPQRAKRLAQSLAQRYMARQPITVKDALARYEQHMIAKGNKPRSITTTLYRLRSFFTESALSVLNLTARKCRSPGGMGQFSAKSPG